MNSYIFVGLNPLFLREIFVVVVVFISVHILFCFIVTFQV